MNKVSIIILAIFIALLSYFVLALGVLGRNVATVYNYQEREEIIFSFDRKMAYFKIDEYPYKGLYTYGDHSIMYLMPNDSSAIESLIKHHPEMTVHLVPENMNFKLIKILHVWSPKYYLNYTNYHVVVVESKSGEIMELSSFFLPKSIKDMFMNKISSL